MGVLCCWTFCGLSKLLHLLRRLEATFQLLPRDVWLSITAQAALTLEDKCAVRSSSIILRRLMNAVTTKVCLRTSQLSTACCLADFRPRASLCSLSFLQAKLDLADELQCAFPPGLGQCVQSILVRATSSAQLLRLRERLTGVPAAAALELELLNKNEKLNLCAVKTRICQAGLIERVRAVKYTCKTVHFSVVFPGTAVPVAVDLWPGSSLTPRFWSTLFTQNLVELKLTVRGNAREPERSLWNLHDALSCAERTCANLRCLQVDNSSTWMPPLPMIEVKMFLSGLKLPCLTHLGFAGGVLHAFDSCHVMCLWPQKENLPMLQGFAGTRAPADLFGLGGGGLHVFLKGALNYAGMAALADSALGPAIRDLYIEVEDAIWEGFQATKLFHSAVDFLAPLQSVQHLSVDGQDEHQLIVRAEVIDALAGLKNLALGCVTIEGDLTGPYLTQINCLSLQTRLPSVLARPPPALTSVLIPHMTYEVVSAAVLGIGVPQNTGHWPQTMPVCACPGGPRWTISHETCALRDLRNRMTFERVIKAVRCME